MASARGAWLGAQFENLLSRLETPNDRKMVATVRVEHASGAEKMAVIRRLIAQLLDQGRRDQKVRDFTFGLVRESGINWSTGKKPYLVTLNYIHRWFTRHFIYVHDAAGVEQFRTARNCIFRSSGTAGIPSGDCDDGSICLASMLGSIGFKPAVLLVDTDRSGILSHALPAVKTPMPRTYRLPNPRPEIPGPPYILWNGGKEWLPLEVTKGAPRADGRYGPGWLPPRCSVVIPVTTEDAFA